MPDTTNKRFQLAHNLDLLAQTISMWSGDLWKQTLELAKEVDHPAAAGACEELIHYSGEFNSMNLLGLEVRPNDDQLANYAEIFAEFADALRK